MVSSAVITSMVAERLCGSMPMTTRSDVEFMKSSDARSAAGYRAGRATLLRVLQTLLEPLLAPNRRPARAGQMRATRPAWAAEMRATNRAPGPSLARPGPKSNRTSSRDQCMVPLSRWRCREGALDEGVDHPLLEGTDFCGREPGDVAQPDAG